MDQTEDGQNATVEAWLRTEVVAAYDEMCANPGRAISSEQLRARLAEVYRQWTLESNS